MAKVIILGFLFAFLYRNTKHADKKFTEKSNRNKNSHMLQGPKKSQNIKVSQTRVFLSPQFRFCLEDAEISRKLRNFGFD